MLIVAPPSSVKVTLPSALASRTPPCTSLSEKSSACAGAARPSAPRTVSTAIRPPIPPGSRLHRRCFVGGFARGQLGTDLGLEDLADARARELAPEIDPLRGLDAADPRLDERDQLGRVDLGARLGLDHRGDLL